MRLGKHRVKVDCHSVEINPNTDTWAVRIWFVWEEDGEPQKIAGNVYFTEKGIRIARKSLKAMGFDPDIQNVRDLDNDQTLLRGNECEIELSEEEWQGNTSIKVKWINAIKTEAQVKKEVGNIDNMLRAAKAKPKDQAGRSRAADNPPADDPDPFDRPPPLTDADAPPATPGDDIPF